MKLISNNVTPIDRNAICPCGSGRKYKKCCAGGNIGAQEAIPDLLPPPISSHEIEKLMKQVKEIAEDKNLSIKEMENLVVGKSFDEIDEEHGNLSHGIKNSPKRKAEELIWDAFEMSSGKKRLKLVENALEIYPYLPDAWMIIAEETANSFEEELVCFKHAVLAGEKDLGKEFFKENEGHFWGMHETRPYMRAKVTMCQNS
jgi:hypothetical protein